MKYLLQKRVSKTNLDIDQSKFVIKLASCWTKIKTRRNVNLLWKKYNWYERLKWRILNWKKFNQGLIGTFIIRSKLIK